MEVRDAVGIVLGGILLFQGISTYFLIWGPLGGTSQEDDLILYAIPLVLLGLAFLGFIAFRKRKG